MYKYLRNLQSSTQMDEKIITSIETDLKKNRISSEIVNFKSEKELGTILSGLEPRTTNTLVIIGNDNDFKIVIGQIGKLDDSIALGFIPIGSSKIAKSLKISSLQSAIECLAQRRINEKMLYSVSSRFFYDEIILNLEGDKSSETETKKIIIKNDKDLELQIPACILKIENISQDKYFSKTPIQIRAFHKKNDDANSNKNNLINKMLKKLSYIKNLPETEPVLSLHGKNFKFQSSINASDDLNRKYNLSFTIGKATKTLRLITKKASIKSN